METWKPSVLVSKITPTREAELSHGLDVLTASERYEGKSNPVNLKNDGKETCKYINKRQNKVNFADSKRRTPSSNQKVRTAENFTMTVTGE